MYFLLNTFPAKPLDVAALNFADGLVRSKAGICDGELCTIDRSLVILRSIQLNRTMLFRELKGFTKISVSSAAIEFGVKLLIFFLFFFFVHV